MLVMAKTNKERDWLSIQEVASDLDVSVGTVHNYIKKHKILKAYQLSEGGNFRVKKSDLAEFKRERGLQ